VKGPGSEEGLCPPQLGVWGLAPEKNQFCAKNYAILSKFWYFFPILQHKNFQHAKIETVTTFNMKSPVNNKTETWMHMKRG